MGGRAAPLAFALLAILLGGAGCSGELGGEDLPWPPPNDRALDREVLDLEQGISAGEIEEALGRPDSVSAVEPESDPAILMMFYGRWRLQLEEGGLAERIKYVFERPIPLEPDPDEMRSTRKRARALTRAVHELELGASIASVKSKLGAPGTYAIRGDAPKEEVLTYPHGWELTFLDAALYHRQRW
jgi:hypothetical protein